MERTFQDYIYRHNRRSRSKCGYRGYPEGESYKEHYARPYGLPLEFEFKENTVNSGKTYIPVGYSLGKKPEANSNYTKFNGNTTLKGNLVIPSGTPKFGDHGVVVNDDGTLRKCQIWVVVKEKNTPGSTTPMPGPSLAPGLSSPAPSAGLALHYHANFEPDDALEETVKTVYCRSAADVTVHPCMFKRAGYAFAGWNTEEDGTGTWYWVNGVPVTDWRDGDTVELYAQWKKTAAQRPVADPDPVEPIDPVDPADPFDPDVPPAELDELFGVDPDAAFDAAPDPLPEELDDAFGVDPGGDTDAPLPS